MDVRYAYSSIVLIPFTKPFSMYFSLVSYRTGVGNVVKHAVCSRSKVEG